MKKWNQWMLALVAAVVVNGSAFAGISCQGFVPAVFWNGAPQNQWAGYYVATIGNNGKAQVSLNGTSFSLDQCYTTATGTVCRETNLPAYVLSTQAQPGWPAGLQLSVDTGFQGTVPLATLTQCNYF